MSSNYEIIRYKQGLNTRIVIHSVNQFKMHWHKELELILVLKGEVQIIVNGIRHDLKEDDMFLVNVGQVHSTIGHRDNIVVAIQINLDAFDRTYPQIKETVLKWPLTDEAGRYQGLYAALRSCISKMVGEYRKAEKGYQIAVESYLNELLLLILRGIPQVQKNETIRSSKDLQRIQSIINYVEEHFTEKITLEQISKNEYLSPYYLSHFFKEKMGIPFQEYLNYVRLNKAIVLLDQRVDNMIDIAMSCGFANVKSFNKAFRDAYGTTPGEYRRSKEQLNFNDTERFAYMEFDTFKALSKLETYIRTESKAITTLRDGGIAREIIVDLRTKGTEYHKWKRLAAVGRAYDCLRADMQEQLRQAKKELGIEYLRFHGIFSDEMRIVTRNKEGQLVFYWQYIDIVLDYLIGLNIYPILDFTFMPSALKSTDITAFWYKGNISRPNHMEDWKELIHQFTGHCINRYGIGVVREWYFEIWNEPEYMWDGTKEDYYELYKTTALALREIDQQLKIAGPSVMSPISEKLSWINEFIEFVNREKLPLDAFTYHIYGENDLITYNGTLVTQLGDKNYFTKSIEYFYQVTAKLIEPVKDIFITEYNISAMHKNFLLDTMFPACHMLYNFLKNNHLVDGIVPWSLSDIFEEDFDLSGPFYGGFGIMTLEGIRKPTWYAQWFLSQLGDEILQQEEEYIITKKKEDIQILAFSYAYYDDMYRLGDRSLVTFHSRYNVFEYKNEKKFSFIISNLLGRYEIREYVLNREQGSAYDVYDRMGSPSELSEEDVVYLKGMSRPQMAVRTVSAEGELKLECQIPPHGIHMILLNKLY